MSSLNRVSSTVLVKKQILDYLKEGRLKFEPSIDSLQLQSHSVDLRLGYTFMVPKLWRMTERGREAFMIDYLDDGEKFDIFELEHKQFFDLLPKESVVATSLEEVSIPDDLMAVLYPRSSINRKGLSVDLTGIIDAGYEGRLLIPVTNNTTSQVIRLYPGERFCQLVFYPLNQSIDVVQSRWHKKDLIVGRLREKRKVEEELIVKGEIKKLKEKYSLERKENGEGLSR
jgi:dCTP deaminase